MRLIRLLDNAPHAAAMALTATLLAACGAGQPPNWHGHDIHGVMPDLAYQLTDENGNSVEAGKYRGDVRLLFFGYTECPDVCPTTLARLKTSLESLPAADQKRVRVLFVSVDPKRDGPAKLAQYTGYFGPEFVGMTGTQSQLQALAKRYRIGYSYGTPDEHGYYTVSHSAGVFVFGPDGEARLLFDQSEGPDDIAADLHQLLAGRGASATG